MINIILQHQNKTKIKENNFAKTKLTFILIHDRLFTQPNKTNEFEIQRYPHKIQRLSSLKFTLFLRLLETTLIC